MTTREKAKEIFDKITGYTGNLRSAISEDNNVDSEWVIRCIQKGLNETLENDIEIEADYTIVDITHDRILQYYELRNDVIYGYQNRLIKIHQEITDADALEGYVNITKVFKDNITGNLYAVDIRQLHDEWEIEEVREVSAKEIKTTIYE